MLSRQLTWASGGLPTERVREQVTYNEYLGENDIMSKKILFCSKENKHLLSGPCPNFPDSLKTDVFFTVY